MLYIHKDYLGSFETVTIGSGEVYEKLSFDPWGRRRNPENWTYYSTTTERTYLFDRGYTGHEHLDNFDLINMNGRVYDPWLGRFLSPDPFVQAPTFSQSYNRYTYAFNNPLKYVDPTGYYFGPPKDVINEGYNDLAGGGFTMGYRGSINYAFRSFANTGHSMPGSGNHWSDQHRSEYGNYMLMNSTNYDNYYGAGSFEIAQAISSNPTVLKEWLEGKTSLSKVRDDGGFYVRSTRINDVSFDTGDGSLQLQEVEIINKWVSVGTIENKSSGIHDAITYGLFGTGVWANTIYAGFEAALKTQPTVSTWLKGSRIFGRGSYILNGANITYDFLSGTANTSTLVNAGVTVVGAGVVIFVGAAATPYVIGGGLVYGIISIAGGDEWLDSNFDISDQLNFIKP